MDAPISGVETSPHDVLILMGQHQRNSRSGRPARRLGTI